MHETATTTGIPIEALFAVIGFLLVAVYGDIKRELRLLKQQLNQVKEAGERRDKKVDRVSLAISFMAAQLKIPFVSRILKGTTDDTGENPKIDP